MSLSASLTPKLLVDMDAKFDTITEDRLGMAKASYRLSPEVIGSLGVRMIGSSEDSDSFWSSFRNNDAVYAAMKYVF